MAWFQLDPGNIAQRARQAASPVASAARSLWIGIIGFTLVSIAGFAPWAVAGRWFYGTVGEAGLYAICAFVFIGSSGLLLHRLIIGPGSLLRFYKLFSIAFAAYSIAWIVAWMSVRGHPGSLAGLMAGTAVMSWFLALAFEATRITWKIFLVLFLSNAAGYFIGGWIEGAVASHDLFGMPRRSRIMLAKLLWGVFYGIGFGAGLGLAFYFCQTTARNFLRERTA